MKLAITSIKASEWVDCSISDCFPDGFSTPSCVMFHTTEEYPVSGLPGAEYEQYGHAAARGWTRTSIRTARKLLRKKHIEVGDVIDITPVGMFRNRAMRKMGTFRVYI